MRDGDTRLTNSLTPMPKTTKSPTQRTMAWLRANGCELVQIVETYNPWGRCKNDLFGFIDVLAVLGGRTTAIQVTSGDHVAERFQKIAGQYPDVARTLMGAGWSIEVHGWRKLRVQTKTGGKVERWSLRRCVVRQEGDGLVLDEMDDETKKP